LAATTKLIVYNAALREIGGQRLSSLSETSTRLQELDGAWDHAVEHVLAMQVWSFARRRATLSGVADTSYPPYQYRLTKPSDFLRRAWLKIAANDAKQIDHVEVGAVFYAMRSSGLLEYVSDHADNYDPVNWPPHFTRVVTLYLASLVGPKLARIGADDQARIDGLMARAMADAERLEALFATNTLLDEAREPVFRRALEFLGQALSGSLSIHNHADQLRWHMNGSWSHAVKYILEQGAWNFATRRALLVGGGVTVPGDTYAIIEGYSVGPAEETAGNDLPAISEWDYGFALPDDFLHKIWLKRDANTVYECPHQFIGRSVFTRDENVVMEYVSNDADALNPEHWTANFSEAVAAYLAVLVTPEVIAVSNEKGETRVTANDLRPKLEGLFRQRLSDAKMRDAMQQYPKRPPPGRFVQARLGGTGYSRNYR